MGLYLGSEIKGVYCGSTEVKEAYVGGVKVYGKESPAPKYNDDIVLLNDFVNEPYGYTHTSGQNLKTYFIEDVYTDFNYSRAGWSGFPCIKNTDYTNDIIWNNESLRNLILNEPFTIEFWAHCKTKTSANTGLFGFGKNGNSFWDLMFSCTENGYALTTWLNDSYKKQDYVSFFYTRLVHIAITMDSSKKVRFFEEGVLFGSAYNRTIVENSKTSNIYIPGWNSGKAELYISQICVRNVCKWTSRFSVPTIPYCISERKE